MSIPIKSDGGFDGPSLQVDNFAGLRSRNGTPLFAPEPLASSGSVTPDALSFNKKSILQTGNLSFEAPANSYDGATLIFRLTMGGAGSYTRTWNEVYVFSGDFAGVVASTAVGSIDVVGFEYHATNAKWYCFSYVCIKT